MSFALTELTQQLFAALLVLMTQDVRHRLIEHLRKRYFAVGRMDLPIHRRFWAWYAGKVKTLAFARQPT